MMRWIVGSSLKFRFIVIAVAVALMYFGFGRLHEMPVDVFPEFAPPMVEIQTPSLGLSAEEVEELVTIPLGASAQRRPGFGRHAIQERCPICRSIKMYFKPGTDLLTARQVVSRARCAKHGHYAEMVGPARDAAAPLGYQPLHEDRHLVEEALRDRSIDDRLLDDPAAIDERARRGQCGHVGRAYRNAAGSSRSRSAWPSMACRSTSVMESTADSLAVGILTFPRVIKVGTGGWVETANQRLPIRHASPIIYSSTKVTPDQLAEVVMERKGRQASST